MMSHKFPNKLLSLAISQVALLSSNLVSLNAFTFKKTSLRPTISTLSSWLPNYVEAIIAITKKKIEWKMKAVTKQEKNKRRWERNVLS